MITVDSTEKTIHVLVPYPIYVALYRKAMVVKPFFLQNTKLVKSFLFFSNIIVTVVNYFDFSTGFTEEEVENVAAIIYRDFLDVTNLQGCDFFNSSNQPIALLDSVNYPNDITFFAYFSTVHTNTIGYRLTKCSFSIKASPYLPQSTFLSTTSPI